MVSCLELESGVLYNRHPYLLFEGAEGVVGVQLDEDRPLADEEVNELLEEFQDEEFTDLEPEEGSQLLQCVIKHHPQHYTQVYGGFWSDVWDAFKTGRTKEEQKEYDELQKYLKDNQPRLKALEKAVKTGEKLEKFIEKYKVQLDKNPDLLPGLAELLKISPEYAKALDEDVMRNKSLRYSVPLKDIPGIKHEDWALDEVDLIDLLEETLQRRGMVKDVDYDKVMVKTDGVGYTDRVVFLDSNILGLSRFKKTFPMLKPKMAA